MWIEADEVIHVTCSEPCPRSVDCVSDIASNLVSDHLHIGCVAVRTPRLIKVPTLHCVGNLVAIETGKRHEFLISLIDKVTRKYIDDFDDTESEENEIMVSSADYVKVSIIGTYHSVLGDLHEQQGF